MCAVRMRICRYVDVVDSSVVGSHLEDSSRRWPAGLRLVVCWFCRVVVQLPTYRTCARLVTTAVEDEALRPEDGGGCAFFDSRALPLRPHPHSRPALAAYCASLVYMFIRLRRSVCILYIRTYAYIHSSHTVFSCSDARSFAPCPLLLAAATTTTITTTVLAFAELLVPCRMLLSLWLSLGSLCSCACA